jgi:23S rRNA (uracil1939-C5)-methyltransferase
MNDTIYDLEVNVFSGEDHLIEMLEDLKFKIGPKSFFQTNTMQTQALYGKTRELAGLTGNENVYDLYTGVGSIALFVSKLAKQVVGIEKKKKLPLIFLLMNLNTRYGFIKIIQ